MDVKTAWRPGTGIYPHSAWPQAPRKIAAWAENYFLNSATKS